MQFVWLSTKLKDKTTMMLEEFIRLTGFTPDHDYYTNVIEQEYMNSDMEKREWCKKWLEDGGIQKAYIAMKNERYMYKESYEQVVHGYRSLRDDYDKLLKEKNDLIKERDESLEKLYGSKNALDAVIEKLNYLYEQHISEKDALSALINKLIEVKIL